MPSQIPLADARTLRRLNRLRKRESAEVEAKRMATLKALEKPEPVLFEDLPWYQLNLNTLMNLSSDCIIESEPLYVCKNCFEYNTAYTNIFVPVEDIPCDIVCVSEEEMVTAQGESEVLRVVCPVEVVPNAHDVSDSKSANSNWTDVSSLNDDELVAIKSDPPVTPVNILCAPTDLSGVVVDVSGTPIDVSGTQLDLSGGPVLKINTISESCAPCCVIS